MVGTWSTYRTGLSKAPRNLGMEWNPLLQEHKLLTCILHTFELCVLLQRGTSAVVVAEWMGLIQSCIHDMIFVFTFKHVAEGNL